MELNVLKINGTYITCCYALFRLMLPILESNLWQGSLHLTPVLNLEWGWCESRILSKPTKIKITAYYNPHFYSHSLFVFIRGLEFNLCEEHKKKTHDTGNKKACPLISFVCKWHATYIKYVKLFHFVYNISSAIEPPLLSPLLSSSLL